jgi:rubrerythrin
MGKIKGTQTEKNALIAFAGESQARNRYTYAADKAEEEGYAQIAAIFRETAEQEKMHANQIFNLLEGGEVEIQAAYPAGVVGTTLENLKAAAQGENHEHEEMYPEFAEVAREEGLKKAAKLFEAIAIAEKFHEDRFQALIENMEKGEVFKKEKKVRWYCRKCGYIHEGTEAPKVCVACMSRQEQFELAPQNW